VERRAILEAIRRVRPDVLHAHWTYFYALAAQASGLPHVVTAHDAPLNVLRREFIPYRIAHTMMAFAVTARAKCIATVSPYVDSHLRRFMFYRGERVVIPNGLPDSVFALARPRPTACPSLTFGTLLSGWSRLKNGRIALKAFALVRREIPDARLVMMGPGHERAGPAHAWAAEHNLTEAVEFAGPLEHNEALQRLSTGVDIFVHPSREESFGMTVAEASALGVPVIAGIRSGAVGWTLDEGRAGLLVDVASPRALAQSMVALAQDRARMKVLSEAGRRNAWDRFRISAIADGYEALYTRIAGRPCPAPGLPSQTAGAGSRARDRT
jgi:glycosyltransferase involved in cell wall biosynthesis